MENSTTLPLPPSPSHNWTAAANTRIISDLQRQGWSVEPDYLGISLGDTLIKRLKSLEDQQALTEAGIGRKDKNQFAPDIRKDRTFWLDRFNNIDLLYLTCMEELRLELNRSLFMGLFEYEAHYAVYPPGGFYKKHIDALKGARNRIVSTVCYLNDDDWQPEDGGMLALYDADNPDCLTYTVSPQKGTLVTFLSEDLPHEVLPAQRARRSIAGWFRCNASSADRPDPLL
jgi:SM-20-related protein